jgi:glycerophosphoryl diester phosphodiesterase
MRMKSLLLLIGILSSAVSAEEPRSLIVAHRGLLQASPENTLSNFSACLELRLGFEFDVQRSKDGTLVCIHDLTVDRTTNGTGIVSKMTLKELRQLDAGSWFGAEFEGEQIPTIDEVLELIGKYRQHDVLIAVDIKANGVEADVVRLAEKHKVLHRLLFIGKTILSPQVRSALRRASKEAQVAAVANNPGEFKAALNATADWVYVRYIATAEEVKAVHEANKKVFIAGSTVSGNNSDNWRKANEHGIDGILTDYPLQLRTTLQKQTK